MKKELPNLREYVEEVKKKKKPHYKRDSQLEDAKKRTGSAEIKRRLETGVQNKTEKEQRAGSY